MRGRPTRAITERTYDDDGHVVTETTTTESPWTEADRWLALALAHHEAALCPGCNQPKDIAWHPDSEGWYDAQGWTCHSCEAIHQAVRTHKPGPYVHVSSADTWPAARGPRDPAVTPVDVLGGAAG